MKIGKVILWVAGISGAAYLAKKLFFKPAPTSDPLQGRPNLSGNTIQEGEKASFTGGRNPRKRFDPGFDGELLSETAENEGFDLMSGERTFYQKSISKNHINSVVQARKWTEPNKSSGGTLSCPRGSHLTTDKDGSKWCVSNSSAARTGLTCVKTSQGVCVRWKDSSGNVYSA